MPRSSRSSRPAPKAAPATTRGAHTVAAPAPAAPHHSATPAAAPAPPAAAASAGSSGPGMLAQMAATAGSVAVGSTIGHGISHMLFGGSSSTPAEAAPAASAPLQNTAINCEVQAKEFTQCLEKADLQSCSWYLEQLKACQAAASQY